MQFMVLAYDGTDDKATERRAAVRDSHLQQAEVWFRHGRWQYAVGILDEEKRIVGSMIVCDFSSKKELKEKWLDHEPYVIGKVWERIEVSRVQAAPFLQS
ncbi:MAG: YciI family protein [Planctomycetota bacterium]